MDKNGGLKVIHLNNFINLNSKSITNTNMLFEDIKNDFIPINLYDWGEFFEIDETMFKILENDVLKHKYKYGLYKNIPLKVEYDKTIRLVGHDSTKYTKYIYRVIKS